MVFSSLIFLCGFLPVVIISYYFLGEDKRLYWLLLASLFFYAWGEPKNLGLMLLICLICFSGAKLMDKVENSIKRKLILAGNIVLLLMSLGYYKYFDFIAKNINAFFDTSIEMRDVTLPIGISFFTFQAISYIIDVYRGTVKVQNSLFKVGLYKFFPTVDCRANCKISRYCKRYGQAS